MGPELDVQAAGKVAELLSPRNRARCACINWTWKQAVDEISLGRIDAKNKHWLVEGGGDGGLLWMFNVRTGMEQGVELDLPWDSIPTQEEDMEIIPSDKLHEVKYAGPAEARLPRVLCCFQGLVLIALGSKHKHALVLGDPLINKWIALPMPAWPAGDDRNVMTIAAFCSDTSTLMVSNNDATLTGTFDLATAEWKVDPLDNNREVAEALCQAYCLGGVFYHDRPFDGNRCCAIACYDPYHFRSWRIVKKFYQDRPFDVIFLAQQHDKMLRAGKRYHSFYGSEDMLLWESYERSMEDMITVLSLEDNTVKEVSCTRKSFFAPRRCHYVAAPSPGTFALLTVLELKVKEHSLSP